MRYKVTDTLPVDVQATLDAAWAGYCRIQEQVDRLETQADVLWRAMQDLPNPTPQPPCVLVGTEWFIWEPLHEAIRNLRLHQQGARLEIRARRLRTQADRLLSQGQRSLLACLRRVYGPHMAVSIQTRSANHIDHLAEDWHIKDGPLFAYRRDTP